MFDYLQRHEGLVLVIIMILLSLPALSYLNSYKEKSHVVVYDCRLAEISPDFPPDVKDQCRKLNAEQYKKDH